MSKKLLHMAILVATANVLPLAAEEIPFRLVIHGGAGTITQSTITPEQEKAYKDKLEEALQAGYSILSTGGSSLEAVQQAIIVMEDSPLFNAGKGAVFTHDARNELDASIMDGKTLQAGAVASITTVKNPIKAAYLVMTQSPHVMLVAKGAEEFLKSQKIEMVDPSYFRTEHRLNQLKNAIEAEKIELDHSAPAAKVANNNKLTDALIQADNKFGTVGAVALDKAGNLAAGTSTGGMTNKRFGRVGDSPIIGAGTYADNNSVAVSATGSGEMFIRTATAYNIAARVKYGTNVTLKEAAERALDEVKQIEGSGGVIVLDKKGNYVMSFNTEGMYRGTIDEKGNAVIAIYK